MKILFLFCAVLLLTACTIYTEKRSEALSQAVFATSLGIENGRIDFAYKTSQEAKRLAYPPKNPIPVPPIITNNGTTITSVNSKNKISNNKNTSNNSVNTNIITVSTEGKNDQTILRLVIPEFLKNAKLLIENSEEWNELLKTKEFKTQLEKDNNRLKILSENIDNELRKQLAYNNQMVIDLNQMQLKLQKKNNLIIKLYIVITLLSGTIIGGVYLRIKGIL